MAQFKPSKKHKMVIRQSTQHDNLQTFTIDVLNDCTADKNDQKKIFITSCDICTKNKQRNRATNDMSGMFCLFLKIVFISYNSFFFTIIFIIFTTYRMIQLILIVTLIITLTFTITAIMLIILSVVILSINVFKSFSFISLWSLIKFCTKPIHFRMLSFAFRNFCCHFYFHFQY